MKMERQRRKEREGGGETKEEREGGRGVKERSNSHPLHGALTVEVESDAGSNTPPKRQVAEHTKHNVERYHSYHGNRNHPYSVLWPVHFILQWQNHPNSLEGEGYTAKEERETCK